MAQNWLQHTLNQRGWRNNPQVTGLVILGLFITLVFAGVYLTQIADYATINREISELIEERDRLERNNEELRAEIAALQTVPRLLERAETLGFRFAEADETIHILVEGYNPNRSAIFVDNMPDEEVRDVVQYDQTFQGWLQRQWNSLQTQFEGFGE